MKLLHIAAGEPIGYIWSDLFERELGAFGDLNIVTGGAALPEAERIGLIAECDVLLTGWGSSPVPVEVAAHPGRLKYICHITGGMRGCVPPEAIEAGIPVTNWGDAPASGVAEGAMTLLLASAKELHLRINEIERGNWRPDINWHGGTLDGLNVGVYGYGAIGRRFVDLLRPFGAVIRIFDPFVTEYPEDCRAVSSLDELFAQSEAVVIHAALCEGTVGTVTRERLAMLRRNGIIVNTARGGIIDQAALFEELESGRLRAGLDVLEPDSLPPDHPARRWENVILTGHGIEGVWPLEGRPATSLTNMQKVCLENLRRFAAGEPLRFRMDRARFDLST